MLRRFCSSGAVRFKISVPCSRGKKYESFGVSPHNWRLTTAPDSWTERDKILALAAARVLCVSVEMLRERGKKLPLPLDGKDVAALAKRNADVVRAWQDVVSGYSSYMRDNVLLSWEFVAEMEAVLARLHWPALDIEPARSDGDEALREEAERIVRAADEAADAHLNDADLQAELDSLVEQVARAVFLMDSGIRRKLRKIPDGQEECGYEQVRQALLDHVAAVVERLNEQLKYIWVVSGEGEDRKLRRCVVRKRCR